MFYQIKITYILYVSGIPFTVIYHVDNSAVRVRRDDTLLSTNDGAGENQVDPDNADQTEVVVDEAEEESSSEEDSDKSTPSDDQVDADEDREELKAKQKVDYDDDGEDDVDENTLLMAMREKKTVHFHSSIEHLKLV
jgi:hypothetical protein